ncbi:MAG: hypothetical protein P1U89_13570 [Verrucomicrobiales bacterium]|nr:hypothetical protein [Verrucomicrobiales bacterium]
MDHELTDEKPFDYRRLLKTGKRTSLRFSEFVETFIHDPETVLKTSASILLDAIKHFKVEAVVRSGEPCLRYKLFQDHFTTGVNAVYGQEFCIKRIVDVIESVDKESGPRRGIVLVGPPASGKTNIVDLISRALEEYSKEEKIKQYTFFFRLEGENGHIVEFRSSMMPNPILLFPITVRHDDGSVSHPRQEIFDHVMDLHKEKSGFSVPSYYQYATLDKRSLDVIETLRQNPRNEGKTLFDLIEEYVRVEEVEYSVPRGKGIANIDDMRQLRTMVRPINLSEPDMRLLNEHFQGKMMFTYEGALLSSNRGMLHIHDAFSGDGHMPDEAEYKPLLMLLGSGKITLEFTQASLDTTVLLTTNLEEMKRLDRQLTSNKLLDRIEKVPVNYLLDAVSEMDILRRDMNNVRDKYAIDPNLFPVAAYYAVLTRLFPPSRKKFPPRWSDEKKRLYKRITPEQKLFIYADQSEDPVQTIKNLPPWDPFRNECRRLGIDLEDEDFVRDFVVRHPDAISLKESGLFTDEDLKVIDDEFMRELRSEHFPDEGRHGLSIRQLQNIMRNTISISDGRKVTVSVFLDQLNQVLKEGENVHHWLELGSPDFSKKPWEREPIFTREIGNLVLYDGDGDYGDFHGLINVVRGIYHATLKREITVATVDRDPERIEHDLRKYIQHALLEKALENKAFAHVLVPRYTYVEPISGEKVDQPDFQFLRSIESIIHPDDDSGIERRNVAQKFLDKHSSGDITSDSDKPVIISRDDNLLQVFSAEYTKLLSHSKNTEGIDHEALRDAFFQKQGSPRKYEKVSPKIKAQVDTILKNMTVRFKYPEEIALDTVIYAIRNDVIDFATILA